MSAFNSKIALFTPPLAELRTATFIKDTLKL
jgi:hypothetical protein